MGDGWLWVTAHRTGEQGMIFRELVQDLDDNIDPNTVFNWFHPNLTKSEAVDLLVKGKYFKMCWILKFILILFFFKYYSNDIIKFCFFSWTWKLFSSTK